MWDTNVVTSAFGNDDIKSMFVGATSSVCQATTTIHEVRLPDVGASCGSTATKGSLIAGQL